ncbi:MAG: hypothetical protein IPI01_03335 [Ignavibacteriae bacterium]|nr:hypothetical protein [Ignavibacteriota bacterium]
MSVIAAAMWVMATSSDGASTDRRYRAMANSWSRFVAWMRTVRASSSRALYMSVRALVYSARASGDVVVMRTSSDTGEADAGRLMTAHRAATKSRSTTRAFMMGPP